MSSVHDFSVLTCRNHKASSVSQIIQRSALLPDKRPPRSNHLQTSRDDLNNSNANPTTASTSSTSTTSLKPSQNPNLDESSSSKPQLPAQAAQNQSQTRTFYKRNDKGELIPLPVSQYTKFENMEIDQTDSSIFILDSAESYGESAILNQDGNSTTWLDEEEHAHERKKIQNWNREMARIYEQKEREVDLLVSELVAKTPTYQRLVRPTDTKKKIPKKKVAKEDLKNDETKKEDDHETNKDEEDEDEKKEDPVINQPEVLLPKLRLTQQKRIRLEKQRQIQEAQIPPKFHPIELESWNDQINWEGCSSNFNETGQTNPQGRVISPNHSNTDSHATSHSPHHQEPLDPHEILSQTRNPELDALEFPSFSSFQNPHIDSNNNNNLHLMWEGTSIPSSTLQPAPLILHESEAGSSIARLAVPPKRPTPFHQSIPYSNRCHRAGGANQGNQGNGKAFMMENDESQEFEQKQRKRSMLELEKKERVSLALGALDLGGGKGRTITSSLMGPGGTERTGRPSRHENSSSAHDAENVEQLELVYNHTLVKADPRIPELRQFHRPRLPKLVVNVNHPWKIQLRVFPNLSTVKKKSSSASSSAVIGSYMRMNNVQRDIQNKIRNAADLSPTEGSLVMFEYCEERPPIQLSKGMASKIVNYYRGDKSRCPISAGGGDRPTRKRAAQVTNTQTVHSGKSEKPPKLVGPESAEGMNWVDLIGIKINPNSSTNKEVKKEKEKPTVNVLPEGVTELLHPKVHGPFIGEVEQSVTQSGLICNLFAAPIFRHKPEPTDFLMILGKKPSNKYKQEGVTSPLGVVLRPCPSSTFCVGQTEPRIKVSAPNATIEKDFLKAFVTFQIAKALEIQHRKDLHGLKLDDIKEWIFPNTPHLPNYIRQRLKQVANHDTKTQMWTTKNIGEDDYAGVEALGRNFSPEGVAAYEAARAAIQRLHDLGIRDLDLGSSTVSNVGAAMLYLNAGVAAARERKTKMTKMRDFAKRDKRTPERLLAYFDKAVSKLEEDAKKKIHMQSVARYIYEELQLTPWHLTSEFIDVHKHTQGTAMMKLTGLGDPSGRSEAYNFLREVDAKPNKETGNSDGALNAQIKKITGTENDLRRLTMKQMAALLLSYGLEQKKIDTLKRWDRVHVIRDVSTRGDGNQDDLGKSRFARGEKMKLSDQKRMYRERIQTIWRQQISALTSDAGVFDAAADKKETEADLDDDDFDLDDDDEEEDDFFIGLASEIVDERKAKGVIQSAGGRTELGVRSQDQNETSTEDAIELMQWQRQREEERKAQERLDSVRDEINPSATGDTAHDLGRKVIRRKITKTFADGRQKTTFKFIVLRHEVEKIKAQKKKDAQAAESKLQKKNEKLSKNKQHKASHKKHSQIFTRDESKRVGHAMFEDEDDIKRDRSKKTNITLQVRQNTRIIKTKTKKNSRSHQSPKAPPKSRSKKSISKDQKLKEKQRREKKMQRRRKELDEADLYSTASQKRGTSNRRERGAARERMPHVMMSQRLESIRAEVEARPTSRPFHRPVNRLEIPRYYEIISKPIDLLTIRDKNSRYEYRTTETFLKDFKLMQNNAVRFNGEDSLVGEEGINIYKFVKETVEANRDEFQSLEKAIQEQLNGTNRKKKKNSPPKAQNPDENSVGATTNVMLDGFQTTVNLGDIKANFDSDSE